MFDFRMVMEDGRYIVDKSMYIEQLERSGNFLFFIRPRRFGKSLFLSMLRYYYDVNMKDDFQRLFKGLWVSDHPTALQGQFQVLHLDFSRIDGSFDDFQQNFNGYMNIKLKSFAQRYARFYPEGYLEELESLPTVSDKLNYIDEQAQVGECKLYLIVDEYDNFTNVILNERGEKVYHALTHASGLFRELFKKFKGTFARILMMGISPVTLDDVTSGYNIAKNLTLEPKFNLMLGFSDADVRRMIRYYLSVGALKADEETLIADMKPWYDGYCFAEDVVDTDPKLYNCDMVTYYLKSYIDNGRPPKEMVDSNTRTDYDKLDKLLQLDTADEIRHSVLLEIAQNSTCLCNVATTFPASKITDPNIFRSLLFYYGMLTVTGMDGLDTVLGIPNLNVRKQYYEYLQSEYNRIRPIDTSDLSQLFKQAALDGEGLTMMRHICKAYHDTTSVRSLIQGERNLQGFMNAYLTLNAYYYIAPEVELSHGYCDFFLMPNLQRCPYIRHSYIIELKYLKKGDNPKKEASQWQEAVTQIQGYAQGERVKALTAGTQLHLLVAQVKGYDLIRLEEVYEPHTSY